MKYNTMSSNNAAFMVRELAASNMRVFSLKMIAKL